VLEQQEHGCWLRLTDSTTTWWAGATLVHGGLIDPSADLDAAVRAAEQFYARHDAPAVFQVCPDCPALLDDLLAARGYRRDIEVGLLTASPTDVAAAPAAVEVDVGVDLTSTWFEALGLAQQAAGDRGAEWRLLQRVSQQAFATARSEGRPVGVGRVVPDDGWAGVFDLATLPAARHQGVGRAVLAALARWAGERGCEGLYLQATLDNAGASRLYEAAGFSCAGRYHYRRRPG
jgi:GNAT superfamily N-acetyltransferase